MSCDSTRESKAENFETARWRARCTCDPKTACEFQTVREKSEKATKRLGEARKGGEEGSKGGLKNEVEAEDEEEEAEEVEEEDEDEEAVERLRKRRRGGREEEEAAPAGEADAAAEP